MRCAILAVRAPPGCIDHGEEILYSAVREGLLRKMSGRAASARKTRLHIGHTNRQAQVRGGKSDRSTRK
jgi:hypothetical protein